MAGGPRTETVFVLHSFFPRLFFLRLFFPCTRGPMVSLFFSIIVFFFLAFFVSLPLSSLRRTLFCRARSIAFSGRTGLGARKRGIPMEGRKASPSWLIAPA